MKYLLFILLAILGICVLFVLFAMICAALVDPKKEYTSNSRFYRWLLYFCTWITFTFCKIKINVRYDCDIPSGRFLFVSNHRSNFDPLVAWHVLPKQNLAFISKPENFHIFVFGRVIRKCCFLPIDRENPRNAITTIVKAADLIKNDTVSIGVYPEGTRSKNCSLLPFHNGVFKVAQKANVPIVVSTMTGTENIHKNYLYRRTNIDVHFLKVLSAEEIKGMSTAEIGDIVLKLMQDDLGKQA